MKIDREIDGDVAVLTLRGEFDSFVVNPYLEEVEALAVNGVKSVVLDMRMVKFIMSTAVGAIVKSRKRMREAGGELVISDPSPFVRDVLDSLGISKVIRVYDERTKAVAELGRPAGSDLLAGNSVVLHFTDPAREAALGKPAVGRILEVREEGLTFQVAQAASYFPAGAEVRVKFRLPLFRKAYYYEGVAQVETSLANEDGARVAVRFAAMGDADRKSIAQFVRDMHFLRDEVNRAGDDAAPPA